MYILLLDINSRGSLEAIMAQKVKLGDFIELDYTAKVKEEGTIFDTTIASVAQKEHLHGANNVKPIILCIGQNHVLPGLDKRLNGVELGNHTFEIPAEEAFGKKSAKLLQLIPKKIFKEQNIAPQVGLQINVDNQIGTIKTVSGGRIIVDFNHPLASKDLVYDITIKRLVTEKKEMLDALMKLLKLPASNIEISEDGKAKITLPAELPKEIVEVFTKNIVELTGVKDVTFLKGVAKEQNNKV